MSRHEHSGYGFFPGGDPRRFHPDEECSSEDERAKWQEACAAWETAEKNGVEPTPVDPACKHIPGVGHAILSGFGLGGYTYDCDDHGCAESEREDPHDPDDANAAFARWQGFDAEVSLHEVTKDEERMRVAFLAGWRAHEEANPFV